MKRIIKLILGYFKNVLMGTSLNTFVQDKILHNLQHIYCNEISYYDKIFNKLIDGKKAVTYHLLYKDGNTWMFSLIKDDDNIRYKFEFSNIVTPEFNKLHADILTVEKRVNENKTTLSYFLSSEESI